MADALDDLKAKIRREYLGRGGIHGVGVSRAKQALRVYVGPARSPDRAAVLEQVRRAATPYPVEVVTEDPPRTS